jgi:hypothetical protein
MFIVINRVVFIHWINQNSPSRVRHGWCCSCVIVSLLAPKQTMKGGDQVGFRSRRLYNTIQSLI